MNPKTGKSVNLQSVRAVLLKEGIQVGSRGDFYHRNCATLDKVGYPNLNGVEVSYHPDYGQTGKARMGDREYPSTAHALVEVARVLREHFSTVVFLERGTKGDFGHHYELHVVGDPNSYSYSLWLERAVTEDEVLGAARDRTLEVLRSRIQEQQRKRAEACKPFDAEIERLTTQVLALEQGRTQEPQS